MDKQKIIFRDLGLLDYQLAWDYQEQLLQENVRKKSLVYSQESGVKENEPAATDPDLQTQHFLLFTEHPPVYTLGKSGNEKNILLDDAGLLEKKIQFFNTNRGGDITFHGPGQIVGYPILDLEKFYTDIGRYLRNLEEVIILTLAEYGIKGDRSPGETGVWIDPGVAGRERKICAIGVRCSRWITMHGFAFNVNTDLSYFNHIIPCGIVNKQVTSLEKELGHGLNAGEVKEKVKKNFEQVFEAVLTRVADQKSFSK
ncbi:MAG: lipoyl(octanoyl) transferase LipB [Chitinophagaceae bacterium]|nr:lipoyl(octanoyl) transferase LipB [Chitinophagaceae bacterium]